MEPILDPESIQAAVAQLRFRTEAFIDGRFEPAQSGKTFTSENPATGRPLAQVAACDSADVDRAVKAARRSFEGGAWSRMKPAERKQVMLAFADRLEANAFELALLDTLEAGKPIADCATMDIPDTIQCLRWHAEAVDKTYSHVAPTAPDQLALILREPVGVVACVVPWNFPAQMAAWKIGPALATGNSVVLKPAELTSLSAIRMAELAAEAGLPPGVFNVVPGLGETAGQALGRHMDVDLVAFTGSTEVGRYFLHYAAESNLKRISLECGGKSPQVVFADAPELDLVAAQAVAAAFWNMGENCSCGSRLIVHRDLQDELVARIVRLVGDWKVGDPLDPAVRLGPMVEKTHLDKVLGYIEAGRAEGARLVLGGRRLLAETGGHFVEATIFDQVDNRMRIAREEIFGPVLCVIPYDGDDEAVAIANDSDYGLAGSVWTADLARGDAIARQVRTGMIGVNGFRPDFSMPFGGVKASGIGREFGPEGLETYTEAKALYRPVHQ
jgi:gamma-glutamyl-gamma-aminobutyraldehyde dehydrogenase